MPRAARLAAVLLLALPALVTAAPQSGAPRLDPKTVSALPSHIQHVAPAVVGIHVEVPSDRPSAATLGAERWGSGVLFDATGYALTVSYVLIDAARVDVVLRDGRKVEGKVAGLDLESGLGVIKLEGPGPWPAASLGDSTRMAVGDITGTVGMDEDGALIATPGTVKSIRAFAASWEYMLDRALFVAPYNSAFGGAALLAMPLLGLIGWARVRLGAHTPAQVCAGVLIGGPIVAAAFAVAR